MITRSLLGAGTAALALLSLATAAHAQEIVPPPTPNADALAVQMRVLGTNPANVDALIRAGELSTKIGDLAAALGFFARATAVAPSNPRIAAGKAGALVMLERPGEALRLYAQAEAAGLSMDPYRAQRGLAYDLVGQPGYAQRDYRAALKAEPDDETIRRLALSLGISGHREEAMTLLDPLLRRSDRGAWRARACIMAMAGDTAGAQKIAVNMMPGGAALAPFFSQLQWLSPADRAFAVHFGEVKSNVARANDARLAPPMTPLPAEPVRVAPSLPAAVQVAATTPAVSAADRRRARLSGYEPPAAREARSVPARAAASRTRDRVATDVPVRTNAAPATVAPQPATPAPTWAVTADARPAVAASSPAVRTPVDVAERPAQPTWLPATPAAPKVEPLTATGVSPAPTVEAVTPAVVAAPDEVPATSSGSAPAAAVASVGGEVSSAPALGREVSSPTVLPPAAPSVAASAGLASIIEAIKVPESELVGPPPVRRTVAAAAPAKPLPPVRSEPTAKRNAPAEVEPKKPEPRKPEPKKPEPKKAEPKKPAPAKTDPARWWVQVAGGARADDLDKDWRRLTAKSSALKGRRAYTAPLRATHRLLTGPFKTEAEARGVVNALAKEGKSAFTFQSSAGQKIEKIDDK